MSKYKGGCACGAVRYEIDGEPTVQIHCQCLHCQKRSGTGHSSYLVFSGRDGMTISGEARTWRVAGDSGQEKDHAFCPLCGAPVYLTFVPNPAMIAIHAGGLDDGSAFSPQAVTYTVRGHNWDTLDPSLAKFERMPE